MELRPKALNSLTTAMVHRMLTLCMECSQPSSPIRCVVVSGAGDKAFCAGGDVKAVVQAAMGGDCEMGMRFFRLEYNMNLAIAQLRLPYVALIDGITMGGGVGVSLHGHFRVATERTVFAMPEVGIGLFPDIGASCFLQRLPGQLGRYMGLTGARLAGAEVRDAGLATHLVPSARIGEVQARLLQLGPAATSDISVVDRVLRDLEQGQQQQQQQGSTAASGCSTSGSSSGCSGAWTSDLVWKLPLVNAHFGHGSVREVVASLQRAVGEARGGERELAFLRDTLAALQRASPLSLEVTWELLRRGQHKTLQQCLEMEFGLVHRFVHGEGDFFEGVRAVLIDKGSSPAWKYESLTAVPRSAVEGLFEPLPPQQAGMRLFDPAFLIAAASRM